MAIMRKPQVRSKHPSHKTFRRSLGEYPFRAVIRLGSTTSTEDCYPRLNEARLANVEEINKVEAIQCSANKKLMKECFDEEEVLTADWWCIESPDQSLDDLPYPIVSKHIYGSRGTGNTLINNVDELRNWMRGKTLSNYIFEKFYNYAREYRLHVTKDGCFYTCRKMLRNDTPEENRWYRNDDNCVWIVEENEMFDKPVNWEDIENECVKALNSLGLDIAGFDVRVQSATKSNGELREEPKYIILESNSACSHGDITSVKYTEKVTEMLNEIRDNKYGTRRISNRRQINTTIR